MKATIGIVGGRLFGGASAIFSRILLALRPEVDGESAVLPALALTYKTGARLRVLEWQSTRALSLRDILARWKQIPEQCERSAVQKLGLAIKKRTATSAYSVSYLAKEARARDCDLVVFSTLARSSWLNRLQDRWLGDRRGFNCCCLVAPPGVRSCVNALTGEFQVSRVLCCGPTTEPVTEAIRGWVALGEPSFEDCNFEDCWNRARETSADLVIFSAGREIDSHFLEQILPQTPCPVLLLPRLDPNKKGAESTAPDKGIARS
ncbi:hypothetical protein JST97_36020 [bacterium]|nr:hypothetical protein [bacterium]